MWADAVGGDRGEFVVIQCRLAREDLPPAEAGALIRRHDELLTAHGKEWSGFADAPGVKRCMFRRGFVEAIDLDVRDTSWSVILDRFPLVDTISIRGLTHTFDHTSDGVEYGRDPIARLTELFEEPRLPHLRGIGIEDAYRCDVDGSDAMDQDWTSHADRVLELVASSGRLGGFRSLAILDRFTERGMHELLGSNVLATVERLAFGMGSVEREQARALLASMPNLRAVDLGTAIELRDIADVVPPSVVEMRLGLQEPDVPSLFEGSFAGQLERLFVNAHLGPHLASFGVFTRLRSLDVRSNAVAGPRQGDPDHRAIPAFARASLPALRELHPFADLTRADALVIAEAFGPQLACLDLTGLASADSLALREHVAGFVRTGKQEPSETFLHTGTNTREPWLRYGLVKLD